MPPWCSFASEANELSLSSFRLQISFRSGLCCLMPSPVPYVSLGPRESFSMSCTGLPLIHLRNHSCHAFPHDWKWRRVPSALRPPFWVCVGLYPLAVRSSRDFGSFLSPPPMSSENGSMIALTARVLLEFNGPESASFSFALAS